MVAISRRIQTTNSLTKIIGDTIVTVANITSNAVTLNWTAASSATGYIVGRSGTDSKGNGPWQTLDPASTLSRVFIDLIPETQYTFYSEPQPGGVRKSLTVTTLAAAIAVPDRGPATFASLSAARTALNTPSDANYVMWNNSWPVDRDLEDIFATELAANDILVLPERAQPYIIDSSEGFRAAGVQSVTGRNGQLPIVSSYKGIRSARTWFAMARARRGVLGLGPNAVIQMSTSSWTQEPQLQDKGSSMENGTYISPGRYWTNTNGVLQGELVGCQEKLLEAAHSSPYFGNFTVKARYLGGVAYHGVAIGGGSNAVVERLDMSGAWHGFLGVPNGESGGVALSSNNNYLISKCILGTRDSTGFRTGTSPVMINSSSGGRIEETDAGETFAGMMTLWNCSGKHTLVDVNNRWTNPGLNLEKCQAGFELEWIGGSNWSNYNNNGGKPGKPSDQGSYRNGLHISLNSPGGSSIITLRGVDIDRGPQANTLCIQSWGADTKQTAGTIQCFDSAGASIPVRLYT